MDSDDECSDFTSFMVVKTDPYEIPEKQGASTKVSSQIPKAGSYPTTIVSIRFPTGLL